jgi:hypothetical protein
MLACTGIYSRDLLLDTYMLLLSSMKQHTCTHQESFAAPQYVCVLYGICLQNLHAKTAQCINTLEILVQLCHHMKLQAAACPHALHVAALAVALGAAAPGPGITAAAAGAADTNNIV